MTAPMAAGHPAGAAALPARPPRPDDRVLSEASRAAGFERAPARLAEESD